MSAIKEHYHDEIEKRMRTETPLIDLAPKMFVKIKTAQEILSNYVEPYSSESKTDEMLLELFILLTDEELVKKMNEIDNIKPSSMLPLFAEILKPYGIK